MLRFRRCWNCLWLREDALCRETRVVYNDDGRRIGRKEICRRGLLRGVACWTGVSDVGVASRFSA